MTGYRRWFVPVLAAWGAIFAGYEVLEQVLLEGASAQVLHASHLLRGSVASLLLAGLAVSLHQDLPSAGTRLSGLRHRLLWLVRLRWVAVLGVALTVTATGPLLHLLPAASLLPMAAIIGLMAGYNAVFGVLARRDPPPRASAPAQILLDLVSLTGLLHYSGGAANPFFLFYLFHVIIAGILLSRWESHLIAGVAFSLFAGMALFELLGWIPSHRLDFLPVFTNNFLLGLLLAFAAAVFIATHFITTIMSDLHQATAELAGEKEKLDGIIQGIGAGLVILDSEGRVTWTNDQAGRWFPAARPGETCHQALAGRSLPCEGCGAREAAQNGRPCSLDHVRGDRRYLVTQTLVRDASEHLSTRLLLIQDVTLERRMEEQLYQSSKLAAVGTLASGIAHELNNPLASISASTDYLRELADERRLDAPFPKHLHRISDHVYRCKEIIDALLGLARKEDQERSPTNVNECMRELVRLGGSRISPKLLLDPGIPTARANPRLLQNVVLNLLLNARDAAGPEGAVELRTFAAEDSVGVSVHDAGPGIPPDVLPRIFEPFFTTKPVGRGTGLGLFLCHRMVEAMGGKIGVATSAELGTTFSVTLRRDAGTEGA